ncbi:MAG: hypothetical protein JXB33_05345 [Clostridia bacterium]|nr:hypothetical protein [Clostridia bacterium]
MFLRVGENPVIPRKPGTFHSMHAANPDILEFGGRIMMYFRGQGDELHDQIGVAWADPGDFNGINWKFYPKNPVIKVGTEQGCFDSRHILDPGSVIIDGKVFLYYSGHSEEHPAAVCLAVSEDGFSFEKWGGGAIVEKAIAPEVLVKDGAVHLFYQRKTNGRFEFFCARGTDGFNFDIENEIRVFQASGIPGTFDEFSVSTCRIWQEDDEYFMIYGGGDRFDDYPVALGLARSMDLCNWKRYPGNPVLWRGEEGEWDEGGLWFGTVYRHGGTRYLWYEGAGAGLGTATEEARAASEICRNRDYGGYARFNFSQIGLAVHEGGMPVW